jgi:hypothetical protein
MAAGCGAGILLLLANHHGEGGTGSDISSASSSSLSSLSSSDGVSSDDVASAVQYVDDGRLIGWLVDGFEMSSHTQSHNYPVLPKKSSSASFYDSSTTKTTYLS